MTSTNGVRTAKLLNAFCTLLPCDSFVPSHETSAPLFHSDLQHTTGLRFPFCERTQFKSGMQRTACVELVSIVLIVKIPGLVFFSGSVQNLQFLIVFLYCADIIILQIPMTRVYVLYLFQRLDFRDGLGDQELVVNRHQREI